jgi:uncharacterized protein YjdB
MACGGGSDVTGPPGGGSGGGGGGGSASVSSVSVTPGSANLLIAVTDSLTLGRTTITATPRDASGNALTGRAVTWSSADTSIARVSATGVVTAVAAGSTTISATSEGKHGDVSVIVTRPAVAQITVTPQTSSIKVNATETLSVILLDSAGHSLSGNRPIVEINNNPEFITVLGGQVTGVAPGTATIGYKSENNITATATVTVTP